MLITIRVFLIEYPVNIPTVGDPETIGLRDNLYTGLYFQGYLGLILFAEFYLI